MIEVRGAAFGDGNRFVNPRPVRISRFEQIAAVIFEENILPVVDIPFGLAIGDLFNSTTQAVIAIAARRDRRGIPRRKLLDLGQFVFGVVRVLCVIAGGQQGLPREVAIVIIRIVMRGVRRELVPGVDGAVVRRAIAHRIVCKALRRR